MIKISSIFGLGVFVALIQYLGLPLSWKNFFYLVSGIIIALLSLLIRRELIEVIKKMHSDTVETETFSESMPKTPAEVIE